MTADRVTETQLFRGLDASDYEVALQAAVQIGWVEEGGLSIALHPREGSCENRLSG